MKIGDSNLEKRGMVQNASADTSVDSFEELVALYDRKIYNLVLRLVGNPDDAADITQDTFYRAFRGWDGFSGRSGAYTWLCRIAINQCKNRARDLSRRAEESLGDGEILTESAAPDKVLERAELSGKIRRAIEDLPWDYRIVAVLRDLQGLSYQEISDAAGLSVDVVKTRLARARGMLRRKLEHYI